MMKQPKNKTSKQTPAEKAREIVCAMHGVQQTTHNGKSIYSDVLGSYTGMTYDEERPVQDADDL